jgi:YjbE family integral membrane protein
LLGIVGVRLAGGLLLLWVCWKMYRELRPASALAHGSISADQAVAPVRPPKNLWASAWAVAIADLSMSLDNVLAVAGAAHEHPEIMVFGLVLSVALMGLAANVIARLIERYRWIGWIGLALILWVAVSMIVSGGQQVMPVVETLID